MEAGDFVTDPQQTLNKYLWNEKGGLKIQVQTENPMIFEVSWQCILIGSL